MLGSTWRVIVFGAILLTGPLLACGRSVPVSAQSCGAGSRGDLRLNASGSAIEYCDGAAWVQFGGAGDETPMPPALLAATPAAVHLFDVVGPCDGACPKLGSAVFVEVRHVDGEASELLSVSLRGDVEHVLVVDDACTGRSLDAGESCVIEMKPQASSDGNYSMTLVIDGSTATAAPLYVGLTGQSHGFDCNPGAPGPGGTYVSCVAAAYNLITTPSGCGPGIVEPVCDGGSDTTSSQLLWGIGTATRDLAADPFDGAQNSVNLMQYVAVIGPGAHPAIEYCDALVYAGFNDWFLPSVGELTALDAALGPLGTLAEFYWSSQYTPRVYSTETQQSSTSGASQSNHVRCMRRQGMPLPVAQLDTTVDAVAFRNVSGALGERAVSAPVIIAGISTAVSVHIVQDSFAVGSAPAYIVNEGPERVLPGLIDSGDLVRLVMNAPIEPDAINTVTIQLGDDGPFGWVVAAGCIPGGLGAGGMYVTCGQPYDLIVAPSSTEGVALTWGAAGTARGAEAQHQGNGPLNSVNLISWSIAEGGGVHPAADYCDSFVFSGFDDWYLPAKNELQAVGTLHSRYGIGVRTGYDDFYLSSTEDMSDPETTVWFMRYAQVANNNSLGKEMRSWVRCVRRDGESLPAPSISVPPTTTGYFVLSSQSIGANFGGISGANIICYDDLVANPWLGKAAATAAGLLDPARIRAFLCNGVGCNHPASGVTYQFAAAGDGAAGGATFTTGADGSGPFNLQSWAGANYFNGALEYWTGRRASGGADAWDTSGLGSGDDCQSWTSFGPSETGAIGRAAATDEERWTAVVPGGCAEQRRLVCMVHP